MEQLANEIYQYIAQQENPVSVKEIKSHLSSEQDLRTINEILIYLSRKGDLQRNLKDGKAYYIASDANMEKMLKEIDDKMSELEAELRDKGLELYSSKIGDTGFDIYDWSFTKGTRKKVTGWSVAIKLTQEEYRKNMKNWKYETFKINEMRKYPMPSQPKVATAREFWEKYKKDCELESLDDNIYEKERLRVYLYDLMEWEKEYTASELFDYVSLFDSVTTVITVLGLLGLIRPLLNQGLIARIEDDYPRRKVVFLKW